MPHESPVQEPSPKNDPGLDRMGEAIREGQLLVLEQIAAGDRLEAVLATLCVLVEQYAREARAVVLVVRDDGRGVVVGAAPSLDDALGSRGAARLQLWAEEVLSTRLGAAVPDVRDRVGEDGWDDFERIGVRAIVAVPVLGPDSSPLGIFALTREIPGAMLPSEIDLVQQYTSLVSVAIRNDQRERSLARSREAIREAQRIGHFGDLTVDLPSRRMAWSEQTHRLYDRAENEPPYSVEEFVQLHLPPERERLERALRGQGPANVDFEVELELPDGRRAHHRFLLSRVQQGRTTRVTGTVQDVTDRRRTEDALSQAQRLESLGLLAGGIAHDFNNLLAAVLANVSLLDRKLPQDAPGRSALKSIDGIVQRAADLTRQILAYAGRTRVREELLSLDSIVREMTGLLSAAIPKNVEIKLALDASNVVIKGDPAQLQQVVMNLVTNAADAIGGESGTISLRTFTETIGASDALDRFPEQGVHGGRFVVLEVADTGVGMAPDTVAKIFDPFYTTKRTGRGLGLSAVRGILRSHGAGFEIQSGIGQGTRFRIALPTSSGIPASSTDLLSPPVHAFGTLLLVEDEDDVRRATEFALRELGFEVVTAKDGHEALELFERVHSSLRAIVSDLSMPRLDGRELYIHVRMRRQDLPFVLCTGYGASVDLRGLLDDPRAALVEKPFRIEDLARLVERLAAVNDP